jgi:hypothetical protein
VQRSGGIDNAPASKRPSSPVQLVFSGCIADAGIFFKTVIPKNVLKTHLPALWSVKLQQSNEVFDE